MSEQHSVARSARTVSLCAVLGSRVLGLVREQVLAALFGANREFDAFLTAFRIPEFAARPVRRGCVVGSVRDHLLAKARRRR